MISDHVRNQIHSNQIQVGQIHVGQTYEAHSDQIHVIQTHEANCWLTHGYIHSQSTASSIV